MISEEQRLLDGILAWAKSPRTLLTSRRRFQPLGGHMSQW